MSINIKTTGVHHVALRSFDMERSKRFYIETLGFELALETPELFLFLAGAAAFGVRLPMRKHQAVINSIRFACFRIYRYLLNDVTQTLSTNVKMAKDDKIAEIELREE